MKHYKYLFTAFFAITVLGTPWLISSFPQSATFIDGIFGYIGRNYTAVFFQEGITVSQLHDKYNAVSQNSTQPKVRIMIVPGHEPNFGGAEYGNLKERDMALTLATYLQGFIKNNSHYETIMSRSKDAWNPLLESYFKDHWNEIISFVNDSKTDMIHLVNDGSVQKIDSGVQHSSAPQNVALRLYGINKWNNENHIDIAIHIHFNNYPRPNQDSPGQYSGFAIYVPEQQYSNSKSTRAIATTVYNRLSKYNAVSNYPKEGNGIVPEQELIAIGSYNTLDAPSMLIEYGYIYEPQFADPVVLDSTLRDLAFQTYLGIQDFFGGGNDVTLAYDTLMLPYNFKDTITENSKDKTPVLALQSALMLDGVYPPTSKTKNDCPRTGKLGPCTLTSLELFQNKYGIKNEANIVGEQTKRILNSHYSAQLR